MDVPSRRRMRLREDIEGLLKQCASRRGAHEALRCEEILPDDDFLFLLTHDGIIVVWEIIREFFESIEVIEEEHFVGAILRNVGFLCEEVVSVAVSAYYICLDVGVDIVIIEISQEIMQMLWI